MPTERAVNRWLCKACVQGHGLAPTETLARFDRTCAHCRDEHETVFLVSVACASCRLAPRATPRKKRAVRKRRKARRSELEDFISPDAG